MMEPRSTATIRALASLAELSANQLEDGASVDDVIAMLRKAAEAVRTVVEADNDDLDSDPDLEDAEIAQDLIPMVLSAEDSDGEASGAEDEKGRRRNYGAERGIERSHNPFDRTLKNNASGALRLHRRAALPICLYGSVPPCGRGTSWRQASWHPKHRHLQRAAGRDPNPLFPCLS
ncbi:hypothetical protein QW131_23355 [Roseibium salinum]|nr:hypothetical protein [Roseibium salinum]